jgi:hypothetical protein
MIYNHLKFVRNADLISLFIACPFKNRDLNCPFSHFHYLKDESAQIQQILFVPQHRLDEMRLIHRACFERLISEQMVSMSNDWQKAITASRLAMK